MPDTTSGFAQPTTKFDTISSTSQFSFGGDAYEGRYAQHDPGTPTGLKTARTRAANFRGKSLNGYYTVSLIAGDGIGPEISQPVQDIFAAAKVPIKWEPIDITPVFVDGTVPIPAPAIDSIRRNGVALKGPLATPVGK